MAVDGALPLDGDVGLDARDNSHVEVTEVLDLVLGLNAGVALALTLLLADAPRLALLAHLRLAVQLCERRLLFPSQGDLQVAQANRGAGRHDGDALSAVFRPADARPRPERVAASTPDAPSAERAEASLPRQGPPRMLERQLQQRLSTARTTCGSDAS